MSQILFLLAALPLADVQTSLYIPMPAADCGEIKAGQPLRQSFDLCNRGMLPVTIDEVAVGCGCLKPTLPQRILQPRESTSLVVEVNTLSQPEGAQVWKTVVRFTHGSEKGEAELQIKGIVVRDVSIEPVALALTIEKEATHTFTVTDHRRKPLIVTTVRCTSPHITARIGEGRNSKAGHTQDILVTIAEAFPPGQKTETLQILTDDPDYREMTLPITINRRTPDQLQTTPAELDLRLASGQKTASGLVRLRDPHDRPLVIERWEADHAALRCKWAAGPGTMMTFRLGVELDASEEGHGIVKIFIKEPKPQVLSIPVRWQK